MNINIAIFASGSGTNAENIIRYFSQKMSIKIVLVLSNKEDAYVMERAKNHRVPSISFSKSELDDTEGVLKVLQDYNVHFLVLAGFLLRIPDHLLHTYPNKIVNIHPSLLPKYGGKGMYGDRVHRAVVESGDKESGITIHHVNENYDEGNIIFQAICEVLPTDTPDEVAAKVHELEYKYYPCVIEDVIASIML